MKPELMLLREGLPEIKGWAGRAARAHRNMLESLVLFAVLVVAAVLAVIPWLRTGVWTVSVIGLAMIFLQII